MKKYRLKLVLILSLLSHMAWGKELVTSCEEAFTKGSKPTLHEIKWDHIVDRNAVPTEQGKTATCHFHAGAHFVDNLLRKMEVIGPSDIIDRDYYLFKYVEFSIANDNVNHVMDQGAYIVQSLYMFKNFGIVIAGEFKMPPELGGFYGHPKNALFNNEEKLSKKLEEFETVKEQLAFFQQAVGPLDMKPVLTAEQIKKMKAFNTYESYPAHYGWKKEGKLDLKLLKKGLKAAKKHLDAGLPLVAADLYGWKPHHITQGGHSVSVTGYRLGDDGQISDFLVLNSYGKKFGTDGYCWADMKFIENYLYGMTTFDLKLIDGL